MDAKDALAVPIALGGLFAMAGAWLAARATRSFLRCKRLARSGAIARGEVIEIRRRESAGESSLPVYRAVVRFRTSAGAEITAVSGAPAHPRSPSSLRLGDVVTVRYDAANPRWMIVTGYEQLRGHLIIAWVGASFVLAGLVSVVFAVVIFALSR
jgi:hypothetical protein